MIETLVGRLGDRGSREAIEIICDPVRTSLQEFDIVFEVDCKAYRSLGHDDVVGKYRAAILPLEEEQRRVVEGAYAGDTSAGLWSGNVIWQKSRGERLLPTGSLADPFLLSVGIGFRPIRFGLFQPSRTCLSSGTLGLRGQDAGVGSAAVNTSQQIGGATGTALLSTFGRQRGG